MRCMSKRNSRRYNRAKRGLTATATAPKTATASPTPTATPSPKKLAGTFRTQHSARPRVNAGIPSGGQFAARVRDEAAVEFTDGLIGTQEMRRAAPNELDRFNQQFDDLDAFVFDGDDIVDVDLNTADSKTMSAYQTLASHGYESPLS